MTSQTSLGKIESGRPKLLSGKNSITIYVLAVWEKSNYDVQNYCLGRIELGRPKLLSGKNSITIYVLTVWEN